MPERDQAGGWRHPGWSWTIRLDRLIPAGYWVAGLFIAFALGNVPSLVTGNWKSGTTWVSLWLSVGTAVVAAAAFGLAEIARRGQRGMIERNGTAYIIQEQARFWDKDTAARFREGIGRQFARVVQIPGPVELDRAWDWSLDQDAWDWETKLDELVRAFQVLGADESRGGEMTPNGVFLWAYWAIATAFGMRLTAADRDLVLDVWQRPSKARAGEVEPEIWAQRPHRFGPATTAGVAVTDGSEPTSVGQSLSATGTAGTAPVFTEHLWPASLEYSWIPRRRGWYGSHPPISVLLIRFSAEEWGPLPPVAEQPDGPLTVRLRIAVPLSPLPRGARTEAGNSPRALPKVTEVQTTLHELRCVPPLNASGERRFPWDQYPALAAEAAAWIQRKARELDGDTLLLGAAMPQEVGLGLGIHAGQVSRRSRWPTRLWPIVFDPGKRDLVAPNLQLGALAVDPALDGSGASYGKASGA
jgi:hypothetical protein